MTDVDDCQPASRVPVAGAGDSISSNPFSTRNVRPGSLPFLFGAGEDATALVARLQANGGWGEIIGPHGSGKSTLLFALLPALQAVGWQPLLLTLHDGERSLRAHRNALRQATSQTLVIIDGCEQLSRWHRWCCFRFCRRQKLGLLITAHRSLGLPALIRTSVDPNKARLIIESLAPDLQLSDQKELERLLHRHAGNMREVLFDLYDMHELRRRN